VINPRVISHAGFTHIGYLVCLCDHGTRWLLAMVQPVCVVPPMYTLYMALLAHGTWWLLLLTHSMGMHPLLEVG